MNTIPDEEDQPDLFEPAPGPAPVQLELFEEELQQLPAPPRQHPVALRGSRVLLNGLARD
ncbi:hypothetical protein D3C77_539550 [compost metagenome]